MKPDDTPEVIDLHQYKAAQSAAKAKEKARKEASAKAARAARAPGGSEPILGRRPRAGLILGLLALGAILLLLLPRLLG